MTSEVVGHQCRFGRRAPAAGVVVQPGVCQAGDRLHGGGRDHLLALAELRAVAAGRHRRCRASGALDFSDDGREQGVGGDRIKGPGAEEGHPRVADGRAHRARVGVAFPHVVRHSEGCGHLGPPRIGLR